ncbi:uncharacterized protein N7503_004113 [Penicillium pulvis]|uniref:uncharacterized protein n=1 Tax=Penicillium pulvis TaxID=1562058 RepID=UPI002546BC1B|nr:uncharacterized protein N7503_004113 [Penicillium pulvis]KAJ5806511.1 hypothetical protein N7503_004113 [Penicillium pulvis]
MADPYNPYTSYSTPAPGGVGYYPPDEQNQRPEYSHQQSYDNYGNTEGQQPPNYNYNAQASPYHLAPDAYQNGAQERSYTPTGQPDHQGPVSHGGNAPANAGYYDGHPEQQPRYTPSSGPSPAVHVSGAPEYPQYDEEGRPIESEGGETDRGLGSTIAGGAAGYYFGHKKEHGLLGALGGAIAANFIENKVKDHRESSSGSQHGSEHGSEHGHHGHHGHHHHHHHHSRSRSHSRHHDEDDY